MSYWVPFCYIFSQMTVTKSMVIPGGSIKFGKFKSISSYLQTKNTPLTPALYPVFTRFYLWSVSYMLCQWGTFFKTVFHQNICFLLEFNWKTDVSKYCTSAYLSILHTQLPFNGYKLNSRLKILFSKFWLHCYVALTNFPALLFFSPSRLKTIHTYSKIKKDKKIQWK